MSIAPERTASAAAEVVIDPPSASPPRRSGVSLAWILRPTLMTVANFLAIVVLAFFLVQLIPGDPVVTATGGRLTGAELEAARAAYGLDGPWWQQFATYLQQLVSLDLGTSLATGRPVVDDLARRLPATLELVLSGLFVACVAATLLAYYTVTHRATRTARVLTAYARSAGALPEYVIGIAFLFLFYAVLHWAPAPTGRLDPILIAPPAVTGFPVLDAVISGDAEVVQSLIAHLVLPVIVMVVAHSALLMKTLIVGLNAAIDDPSTRFRIASGASRRTVIASVFRRALPSAVAMLGMVFGLLLGGAVVLEALFGLGGLGQYAVDAVNSSDVFALRSFLVVTAAVCLAAYLVTDIAIAIIDPRRRSGSAEGVR